LNDEGADETASGTGLASEVAARARVANVYFMVKNRRLDGSRKYVLMKMFLKLLNEQW
jgi:hypothetical protein